jgi:hypothetical protein
MPPRRPSRPATRRQDDPTADADIKTDIAVELRQLRREIAELRRAVLQWVEDAADDSK